MKINIYTCENGHKTITVDRVEGTTPFMIECLECGKASQSCMYQADQTLEPSHEWVKLNEEELMELSKKEFEECPQEWKDAVKHDGHDPFELFHSNNKEHSDLGGLFMRKIKTNLVMQKIDSLNQVADFHRTFQHPIVDVPSIPAEDRCKLRVSLISEELKELEEAIAAKDIVEIADALCDIQYVLSGAALEFGLGEKFVELFEEVQRSNMSKACKTKEEAQATVNHYMQTENTEGYYKEVEGLYLVYRTSDNKTLKSINYSPADLKSIIEK